MGPTQIMLDWRIGALADMARAEVRAADPTYKVRSVRLDGTRLSRANIEEDMMIGRTSLQVADMFYWSPEMTSIVWDASEDFPFQTHRLYETDMPTEAGCFYFPNDLYVGPMQIRAMLWQPICDEPDGHIALHAVHDRILPRDRDVPDEDHPPSGIAYTVTGRVEAKNEFGDWDGMIGTNYLRFDSELMPKDKNTPTVRAGAFFLSALVFLQQRIMTTSEVAPDRATRRRTEREGLSVAKVRVVQLRRRESSVSSGEHSPVEWAYQWMVGGHWRQQYYPSIQQHKTIRIFPYTKGPADKPFRADTAARVFKVAR
jgi:hypothetical protein